MPLIPLWTFFIEHHLYSYYNIFKSALWSGKDESRWGTSCRIRATALPLEEKSFCFYMLCSCIYVYICVNICACALYLCLHLCHYFTCPVSGKEIEEPVAEEGQRPLSLAFQFEPTPLLSATFFSGSSFLTLITFFFITLSHWSYLFPDQLHSPWKFHMKWQQRPFSCFPVQTTTNANKITVFHIFIFVRSSLR